MTSIPMNESPVSVRGGWPGAGRVGAGRLAPDVTRESHDPFGVSCAGSVHRVLGAGADPGPPRWLDQKHVRRGDLVLVGVARYRPAS